MPNFEQVTIWLYFTYDLRISSSIFRSLFDWMSSRSNNFNMWGKLWIHLRFKSTSIRFQGVSIPYQWIFWMDIHEAKTSRRWVCFQNHESSRKLLLEFLRKVSTLDDFIINPKIIFDFRKHYGGDSEVVRGAKTGPINFVPKSMTVIDCNN